MPSKKIDSTWMCDSMKTRDSAPRVCPRSRETRRTVLCHEYGPQVLESYPDVAEEGGSVMYRLTPVPTIGAPESLSAYGHVVTWTVMVSQMARY